MPDPERAKLFAVDGPNDRPTDDGIEVQFNPTNLKVSLSNTLKANGRGDSSRSAQFVDKSSSNLVVQLIFDTSDTFSMSSGEGEEQQGQNQRTDVRTLTGRIAEQFLKPIESGENMQAPKKCLFQWGSFEFVGLMLTFSETLDFFGPEGTPLRATVAIKLSEDRFQFRSAASRAADQQTPTMTSTGAGGADGPDQNSLPVGNAIREAGGNPRDWRNTAMFNGIESPRLPSVSAIAVPKLSAAASSGLSSALKTSASSAAAGLSDSASSKSTPPAFKYGASESIGTGIVGAFSRASKSAIESGTKSSTGVIKGKGTDAIQAQANNTVGFD